MLGVIKAQIHLSLWNRLIRLREFLYVPLTLPILSQGKYCDRMASVTKTNIRRLINEMNDCITSSSFADANKSTRFMTVMACHLPDVASKNNARWSGIQNYNNLLYKWTPIDLEMKVTVRRAFGIGLGQSFRGSKLSTSTNVISAIHIGALHDNNTWQTDSLVQGKFTFTSPC